MFKKIKSLIKRHFHNNFIVYFIMSLFFVIGIIVGSILINKLNHDQSLKISKHFSWIFNFIKERDLDSTDIFVLSLLSNLKIFFFIWILALTIVGSFIIPIIIIWKGVSIGFTVGFLVKSFGMKGFMFSLMGLLPDYLILIPGFVAIGVVGMSNSIYIGKGRKSKIKQMDINDYSILMVLFLVIILVGCFIEGFFTPYFFKITGLI